MLQNKKNLVQRQVFLLITMFWLIITPYIVLSFYSYEEKSKVWNYPQTPGYYWATRVSPIPSQFEANSLYERHVVKVIWYNGLHVLSYSQPGEYMQFSDFKDYVGPIQQ